MYKFNEWMIERDSNFLIEQNVQSINPIIIKYMEVLHPDEVKNIEKLFPKGVEIETTDNNYVTLGHKVIKRKIENEATPEEKNAMYKWMTRNLWGQYYYNFFVPDPESERSIKGSTGGMDKLQEEAKLVSSFMRKYGIYNPAPIISDMRGYFATRSIASPSRVEEMLHDKERDGDLVYKVVYRPKTLEERKKDLQTSIGSQQQYEKIKQLRLQALQKERKEDYMQHFGSDTTKWQRLALVAAGLVEPADNKEMIMATEFAEYVNKFGYDLEKWNRDIKTRLGINTN